MAAACFVSNFLYNGDMFVESEYLGKGLISFAIAIVFLVTSGVTGYSVLHMRNTISSISKNEVAIFCTILTAIPFCLS